jgi:VWFA-related protein
MSGWVLRSLRWLYVSLVLCVPLLGWSQQTVAPGSSQIEAETAAAPPSNVLRTPAETAVGLEGLIRLDVVVTNEAGDAVSGLERKDFTLLDNGQPLKIAAFRPPGTASIQFEPPVAIILLVDTLDLPPELAAIERKQTAQFLRQSARSLAGPVTIYSLEDSGFWRDTDPSLDGNRLAKDLESSRRINLLFGPPNALSPFNGTIVDKEYSQYPPITALRAIGAVATAEYQNPGKKLLLWVGPGLNRRGTGAYLDRTYYYGNWEWGGGTFVDFISSKFNQGFFEKVYWLSTLLRQARISIDSFSVGEYEWLLMQQRAQRMWMLQRDAWKPFLAGVPSVEHVSVMNLYKKVLAIQSGGRVLPDEGEDLAKQMSACVPQASTFYTLTFDPPQAAHANEYHHLRVKVSQPGLTARTNTGYYDQPFYDDPSDPAIRRRVTVAQLDQFIHTAPSSEVAQQLSTLQLTERLSSAQLASFTAELHGRKAREALDAVADQSALLVPPPSEIVADPPPDLAAQQRILAAAADYLNRIRPKLPNFLATRNAVDFAETAAFTDLTTTVASVPLHAEERYKASVLYRDGAEIVEAARGIRHSQLSLITYGTFGPMLVNTIRDAMDLPGSVRWSRWEKGPTGRRAVFRFLVPSEKADHYRVKGRYLLGGVGIDRYVIAPGYHGEISIDPDSGAILRAQVQADLPGFVPADRADIMVAYGPVELGGKTYILPVHSVSIWRGRTLQSLEMENWNESFLTWGPYETRVSEFTFDHYHMFHGESRLLPGYTPVSNDSTPRGSQAR